MPYRGCIRIVIVGLSGGQCPEIIAIVDALSKHTDVSHHQIVSLCQTKGHWPPWKGLAWVFLQTLMFEQKPEKPFVFESRVWGWVWAVIGQWQKGGDFVWRHKEKKYQKLLLFLSSHLVLRAISRCWSKYCWEFSKFVQLRLQMRKSWGESRPSGETKNDIWND